MIKTASTGLPRRPALASTAVSTIRPFVFSMFASAAAAVHALTTRAHSPWFRGWLEAEAAPNDLNKAWRRQVATSTTEVGVFSNTAAAVSPKNSGSPLSVAAGLATTCADMWRDVQ
jgi:hypothetical protein